MEEEKVMSGTVEEVSCQLFVVSVVIGDDKKFLWCQRDKLFVAGSRFQGPLDDVLEELMKIDVMVKPEPDAAGDLVVLAAWLGDKPDIVEVGNNLLKAVYNEEGVLCRSGQQLLIAPLVFSHGVLITRKDILYLNGLQLEGGAVENFLGQTVSFDARPLSFRDPSGASFYATCVWLGETEPEIDDRFRLPPEAVVKQEIVSDDEIEALESPGRNVSTAMDVESDSDDVQIVAVIRKAYFRPALICLDSEEDFKEKRENSLFEKYATGTVCVIVSSELAVVDVCIDDTEVKAKLPRQSLDQDCRDIRGVLSVGDRLCMLLRSSCDAHSAIRWIVVKASKGNPNPKQLAEKLLPVDKAVIVKTERSDTVSDTAVGTPRSSAVPVRCNDAPPVSAVPVRGNDAPPVPTVPVRGNDAPPVSAVPVRGNDPPPVPTVPVRGNYAPPVSTVPVRCDNAPPVSAVPVRGNNAPPVSTVPVRCDDAPPVPTLPVRGNDAPPVSTVPVRGNDAPPVSTVPVRGNNAPPVSTVPVRGNDVPPVSTVPARGNNAPPVSTVPVRGNNAPPVSTVPVRGNDVPPVRAVPIRRNDAPSVQIKTTSTNTQPVVPVPTVKRERSPSGGNPAETPIKTEVQVVDEFAPRVTTLKPVTIQPIKSRVDLRIRETILNGSGTLVKTGFFYIVDMDLLGFRVLINPALFYVDGRLFATHISDRIGTEISFDAIKRTKAKHSTGATHRAALSWQGKKPSPQTVLRRHFSAPTQNLDLQPGTVYCGLVMDVPLHDCCIVKFGAVPVLVPAKSLFVDPWIKDTSSVVVGDYLKFGDHVAITCKVDGNTVVAEICGTLPSADSLFGAVGTFNKTSLSVAKNNATVSTEEAVRQLNPILACGLSLGTIDACKGVIAGFPFRNFAIATVGEIRVLVHVTSVLIVDENRKGRDTECITDLLTVGSTVLLWLEKEVRGSYYFAKEVRLILEPSLKNTVVVKNYRGAVESITPQRIKLIGSKGVVIESHYHCYRLFRGESGGGAAIRKVLSRLRPRLQVLVNASLTKDNITVHSVWLK